MEVLEQIENGKEVKSKSQQCAEELDEILKKYNCTLICQRQEMYGQIIYVPSIVGIKK